MLFEKISAQKISQLIYRTVIVMLSLGILLTTATDHHSFAAVPNSSLLQLGDGDGPVIIRPIPDDEGGDLGDAPDSTNHSNTMMSAYPSINARYPTVYDASAPDAPGPKHWQARTDAWLGRYVSLEQDADLLPDEDKITNLIPPSDRADLDDFDDGVRLDTVQIPECGLTTFDYDVNVPTGAALGRSGRVVNVWFDYNRDGDWEDSLVCETIGGRMIEVTEWSVQNHIIFVGPGYHTLTTPNFEAMNSLADAMWMRITLSESDVPLSPQSDFTLADGRGPNDGYRFGETEDYYLNEDPIILPGQPDMTIRKSADPDPFVVGQKGTYILEVTNIGGGPTTGLTEVQDILPDGIVPTSVTVSLPGTCDWNSQTVICDLPNPIAPGASYTIVIEVNVTNQADPVVENCASVETANESNYANNESCVRTDVETDIEEPVQVIYVSSSSGGNVSGIQFRDEDILTFNPNTGDWAMYFDGSDVGIGGRGDVNAFHVLENGDILMSFNQPITINGTPYDDSDIVYFAATSLGIDTDGTFKMYLDGSDVLLTTDKEDIDAISIEPGGDLVISTLGSANVGFLAKDEDLIRFKADSLGPFTSGSWELYFDGSDVGLTVNSEDVWATWIDETGEIHLSTSRDYNIPGSPPLNGDSDDIFICHPISLGNNTDCTFDLFWDGDNHDFGDERIDGYSVGLMSPIFGADAPIGRRNQVDEAYLEEDAAEDDTADDDVLEEDDDVTMQIYLPVIEQ